MTPLEEKKDGFNITGTDYVITGMKIGFLRLDEEKSVELESKSCDGWSDRLARYGSFSKVFSGLAR